MFRSLFAFLVLAARLSSASPDCTGRNAVSPQCNTNEAAYHRDIFYIGGHYEIANATQGTSFFTEQMYVEKLTPVGGTKKKHPIVFISAGLPSGSLWLNTPDNRAGWASYFIKQGYPVYIVDIVAVGRSSQNDISNFPMRLGSTDTNVEAGFTAPEKNQAYPYPQSVNHTQWPGNGTRGYPIFDAFMASIGPLTANTTKQELAMRAAGCELLELIGESYLISHSAGATYSILLSDECPDLVRGSINIEPGNLPFQTFVSSTYSANSTASVASAPSRPWGLTNTPVTYDPPVNSTSELHTVVVGEDTPAHRSCYIQNPNATIHTLPNIAKVPFLMLTGSGSVHITYDHCFPEFLNQAGVETEWILLADRGILGNGHFMMVEKNSDEVAAVVAEWIDGQDDDE